MVPTIQQRLTTALMRIRADQPFFGTLGLFASFHVSERTQTASTDGKNIWLNPTYVETLDFRSFAGLLLHELLHAALLHCSRRRERLPILWNVAADIVANGIILNDTDYVLPKGAVVNNQLCHLSVEEVYEQLIMHPSQQTELSMPDLLGPEMPAEGELNGNSSINSAGESADKPDACKQQLTLQAYWQAAICQSSIIAKRSGRGYGSQDCGQARDIDELLNPTIGWRDLLWQYVVNTPSDYSGFDRRFVWQRLYLDDIVGESLQFAVAIDTSGSIQQETLSLFTAELKGILDAYPHLEAALFYVDTKPYGPFNFSSSEEIPKPRGGGGTSFVEFFEYLAEKMPWKYSFCLYFTDGYGTFPDRCPSLDVLWIITPGGIDSTDVPFGNVVRMGV